MGVDRLHRLFARPGLGVFLPEEVFIVGVFVVEREQTLLEPIGTEREKVHAVVIVADLSRLLFGAGRGVGAPVGREIDERIAPGQDGAHHVAVHDGDAIVAVGRDRAGEGGEQGRGRGNRFIERAGERRRRGEKAQERSPTRTLEQPAAGLVDDFVEGIAVYLARCGVVFHRFHGVPL